MVIEGSAEGVERRSPDPAGLLKESGALLYGDFTLASGRRSSYYFDSKKLTLYPPGARFVGTELVQKLDAEGINCVGGVAYGAIPIVAHISLVSDLREGEPIRAFYHRKESKGHGTEKAAEGQFPQPQQPVAIIEDVVTTGGSLLQAIREAEAEGYHVTHALTLVDRDEGGREIVEAAGYKFWSLFRVEKTGDEVSFVYNGG